MMLKTIYTLFLVVVIFASVAVAQTKEPNTLKLGVTEACPHMCPTNSNRGFTIDITQAVLEKYNYNIEFVNLPWGRAVTSTNNGNLNGLVCTGKQEAPLLLYPKMELGTQKDCFFGLANDDWYPQDIGSFKGRKTIIFPGWVLEESSKKELGQDSYDKAFKEFALNNDYINRSISMIEKGRANAFWNDPIVFSYFLEQNKQIKDKGNIKNLGCIKNQNLYVGFSPTDPGFAKKVKAQFDEGMMELRQSGELKVIMAKYGLEDWR